MCTEQISLYHSEILNSATQRNTFGQVDTDPPPDISTLFLRNYAGGKNLTVGQFV